MSLRIVLSTLSLSLVLTACGGGGSDDTSVSTGSTNVVVDALTVASNNGMSGGTPEISVAKQDFNFSWSVTSPKSYHLDAFISADKTVSDDDRQFVSVNCGMGALSLCDDKKTATCSIMPSDSSYKLSCSNVGTSNSTSLSNITLPHTTQLLIKVCDALVEKCVTVSQPIKIVS